MPINEQEHSGELLLEEEAEEFDELIKYTLVGYVGVLLLGGALDRLGFQRSAVGQWLVRTVSGEGESLLEGLFALRKRLSGGPSDMAAAYGWGKLIGMTVPWWIDWGSRALGVDVYGVPGFYIPYFYAMSDQDRGQHLRHALPAPTVRFLERGPNSLRAASGDDRQPIRDPDRPTGIAAGADAWIQPLDAGADRAGDHRLEPVLDPADRWMASRATAGH